MEEQFHRVAEYLGTRLVRGEVFCCSFLGEQSEFVRFNQSRVRHAGSVNQSTLMIDWIEGRRHASATLSLSGDFDLDRSRLSKTVDALRAQRAHLPEDPFLHLPTEVRSTDRRFEGHQPDAAEILSEVQRNAKNRDLVGFYAGGPVCTGFANSFGQRNWHASASFNFEWSLFATDGPAAVKSSYAGTEWNRTELERRLAEAVARLEALSAPMRTIAPGGYRVYLAPAALYEVMGLLGWGGFGLRAHRTRTSPLLKMTEEGIRLHPSVTIVENTRDGLSPNFQEAGFTRPDQVVLIENGSCHDFLTSPRSAAEYGVACNGASLRESPQSVEMPAGSLDLDRIPAEIGTGLYVNNLHYLNYSDRSGCRMTGLTRFATLWVENGRVQGPVAVGRFDETLYRMLGVNLVALTKEREWILDPQTYGRRSTDSARLPGALIDDFRFTL